LKRALDGRARAELNELARYLIPAAVAGRAALLARRPYLRAQGRSKDDDVQEVLVVLFRDDGRILRKFDPDLQRHADGTDERGLRRFVVGVALNVLLRSYQKRRVRWESIEDDMATLDPRGQSPEWSRLRRVLDLERAVETLSASDRSLFQMIYVEQAEQAECCVRLGIHDNTFQARKSRLLKRLRRIHDEGVGAARRAHG